MDTLTPFPNSLLVSPRARRTGAPRCAIGFVAREREDLLCLFIAAWDQLQRCLESREPSDLHRFRVTCRAYLSSLELMTMSQGATLERKAHTPIRKLLTLTNHARDWHVLVESKEALFPLFKRADPRRLARLSKAICAKADSESLKAFANLEKNARESVFGKAIKSIAAIDNRSWKGEAPSSQVLFLKRHLRERLQLFSSEVGNLNFAKAKKRKIHGIRLSIRKLRYIANRLSAISDDNDYLYIQAKLKSLQSFYGYFNDIGTQRGNIESLVKNQPREFRREIDNRLAKEQLNRRIAVARETIRYFASEHNHVLSLS